MTKPAHLGREYDAERWHELYEYKVIEFKHKQEDLIEVYVGQTLVGTIEPRPRYCDRGRYKFLCDLPDIDSQDGFPRYYMQLLNAKLEIIAWLNWRLWRVRSS